MRFFWAGFMGALFCLSAITYLFFIILGVVQSNVCPNIAFIVMFFIGINIIEDITKYSIENRNPRKLKTRKNL